jgi:hypothetical protein
MPLRSTGTTAGCPVSQSCLPSSLLRDPGKVIRVTIGDDPRRDAGHLRPVRPGAAPQPKMMPPGGDDLALPAERRSPDPITCAAACGRLRSMAASALRHGSPHPRRPEAPRDLPAGDTRLDQLRPGRPHLFPPGLPRRGQPAIIGKLLCLRHSALCARVTRLSNPAIEDRVRTLPSTGPELLRKVLRGCSWVFCQKASQCSASRSTVHSRSVVASGRRRPTYTARLSNRSPLGAVPVPWIREIDTRSSAYTHRPSWWNVSPKDPASSRSISARSSLPLAWGRGPAPGPFSITMSSAKLSKAGAVRSLRGGMRRVWPERGQSWDGWSSCLLAELRRLACNP